MRKRAQGKSLLLQLSRCKMKGSARRTRKAWEGLLWEEIEGAHCLLPVIFPCWLCLVLLTYYAVYYSLLCHLLSSSPPVQSEEDGGEGGPGDTSLSKSFWLGLCVCVGVLSGPEGMDFSVFLRREILKYFQSLGSCTNPNHSLTRLSACLATLVCNTCRSPASAEH